MLPPRLGYNSRPRRIINFMSDSPSYVTFVGFFHIFLLSKCIIPLKHLIKYTEICEIMLKFNLIVKLCSCCTYTATAQFGQSISPEELGILRPLHTVRNTHCAQTCSQGFSNLLLQRVSFCPYFILTPVAPALTSPGARRLQGLHGSLLKEQLIYALNVSRVVKQHKSTNEEPHTIFLPAVCNQARKYPSLPKNLQITLAYLSHQQQHDIGNIFPRFISPC